MVQVEEVNTTVRVTGTPTPNAHPMLRLLDLGSVRKLRGYSA